MYEYDNIRVEKVGERIAVMSWIRPDKLNSWTMGVIDDMLDFFTALKKDDQTSVVIIRGEGQKAVCAGMDFADVYPAEKKGDAVYSYAVQEKLCAVIKGIHECPQVVISLSFGHAIGGGFFVALASDLRIVADNVKFSVPLAKMGMGAADLGSSYFMYRAFGSAITRDLLFTSRPMKAEEAVRLGFAKESVPAEALDDAGLELAKMLAEYDPRALRLTKAGINFAQDANGLDEVLAFENRNNQMLKAFKQSASA